MATETTITATRRIQFCAGHRVWQHESKCRNMHGHNYVVFFEAVGEVEQLDGLGRVLDFSVLKARLGGWIEEHWDHGFIYFDQDAEVIASLAGIPDQKLFALPYNPTAENMGRYLLEVVGPVVLAGTGTRLVCVTVLETENCSATVRSAA